MTRIPAAICLALAVGGCDGDAPALPLVGTIEHDRIELVAEANERIVEVAVTEGSAVEAGALVLRLDPVRRQAELRAAAAQRDGARERLAELVRGPRLERIREARARLEGARENLAVRTSEANRVAALLDRSLASESDLDRARNARESAEADVAALTAGLDELLEGTTPEEIGQAQARLDEAEARLEIAQIGLDRLTLHTPAAGTIDALPYEAGERPAAGATVAVMLVRGSTHVRVYVPEPLRPRIRPGQRASIRVDGVAADIAGQVRYVSSDPVFTPYYSLTQRDRSRLAYLAEIAFDGEAAAAVPAGQPAEVNFPDLQ